MLLPLELLLVLLLGKLCLVMKLPLISSRHHLLLGPLVRGGHHMLLRHLMLPVWTWEG